MRRGLARVAGLVALTALTGCQTWQDKADAAALADCAKIAEPGLRAGFIPAPEMPSRNSVPRA